jgi:Ni,Fe-hydrogenase maturation factor
MNPLNVLRLASSMGPLKRVLLVGCEPGTLGPEEGQMGLSEQVEAVLDEAVKLVESLIAQISTGNNSTEELSIEKVSSGEDSVARSVDNTQ